MSDGLVQEGRPPRVPPAQTASAATVGVDADVLREVQRVQHDLLGITADVRLAEESLLRAAMYLAGATQGLLFGREDAAFEIRQGIGALDSSEPAPDVLALVEEAWESKQRLWRACPGSSAGRVALPLLYPPRATAPYLPDRRRVSIARIPHGEPLGVVVLDRVPIAEGGREAVDARLHAFAGLAANVLLNIRWMEAATTDGLTGLLTRERFESALEDLFEQAQSDRLPLSILLVDIHGLRDVNAAYGRAAGDELLRQVARLLRRHSRRCDVLARYGADEFGLALPNTDTAEALQVADRMRRAAPAIPAPGAFEARSAAALERCLLTRLSIGLATYPTHGRSAYEVVRHADQALFASGRQGQSRVEIWTPGEIAAGPRSDRMAGVMNGRFAEDVIAVRSLLELLTGLLNEPSPDAVWRRLTDGLTEAADAALGILFRVDTLGRVEPDLWGGAAASGDGVSALAESAMEKARAMAEVALRTGRPTRESGRTGTGAGASCRAVFPVAVGTDLRAALYLEGPGGARFAGDPGAEQISTFIAWLKPALDRLGGQV